MTLETCQRQVHTFRATSHEVAEIRKAADTLQVPPATFVRTAVLMVARRALSTDPLVMDLAKSLGPGPAAASKPLGPG